ncbi:DEAD/DEAH box helicase [Paragonimus heterotremus]|uniref:RNA helicase n=1 Tax=Paragonimus heterotremus TaxID=100268 RepID=A0A8J4SSD1_9TREM|nr:DEAD/DEAH box helicase [Paragonimus heterotremus]
MTLVEEFHLMNLDQRLLKAIADLGWEKPTDVQQAVIPLIFEQRSIVVHAKTGSGKTAAFVVPILHEILQTKQVCADNRFNGRQLSRDQCTTALVLAPTKELCSQAYKNIRLLCKYATKNVTFVDVSQHTDDVLRPLLAENPDIVIGTPARVLSHLRSDHLCLTSLKHLIVDEADLVFTFGYQSDMQEFRKFFPLHALQASSALSFSLQVVLLSATLDDTTKALRRCLVKGGDWVRVELPDEAFLPSDTQLTQYSISAEEDDKYTILIALIKLKLIRGKTLIFTNSVDRCFKLRLFLEEFGIRAALLNSELPVMSRCHAIDQFNRGVYDYLLATDECQPEEKAQSSSGSKCSKRRDKEYGVSRGIDFQMVSNVINFDFPLTPTFYVHRVGRTARADQMGTALSFVNRTEEKLLTAVEALLNPAGLAASSSQASGASDTKASSIFRPYQFRLSEVDGFRYRAMDVLRRITRKVIREARLKEIKLELLNSHRLKGYFEDHTPDLEALRHDKPLVRMAQPHLKDIPEYLVPAPLRALMSGSSGGRRVRNRWKRENLNLGTVEKPRSAGKKKGENQTNLQTKHQLARKRKAQNPLFSFGKKKSK